MVSSSRSGPESSTITEVKPPSNTVLEFTWRGVTQTVNETKDKMAKAIVNGRLVRKASFIVEGSNT